MRGTLAVCSAVILAVVIGVAAVAASGTTRPPAPSPSRAATGSICASTSSLTSAVITRRALLTNRLRFAVPAHATLRTPAGVARLARALCALPPVPAGVMFCAVDLGVRYEIVLSRGARVRARVVVEVGGCATVTGLGTTRSAGNAPRFWTVLAAALGRPNATLGDLAGTIRATP